MTAAAAPVAPGRSSFALFLAGAAAPFRGLAYMMRNPALWRYGLLPVLLNAVITLLVLVLLAGSVGGLGFYLHDKFADDWWGRALEAVAIVALAALAVGMALVVWKLLEGILCGHFYGLLAREVELKLGLPPELIRDVPLSYQVRDTIKDVALLLLINGGCLLLNCVPFLGVAVAVTLDSYLFGKDYFDFPLALRGRRLDEKRAFCRRHRPATLGLGVVVLLFTFIPLVGAVVLTTAATGEVLLHRELENA